MMSLLRVTIPLLRTYRWYSPLAGSNRSMSMPAMPDLCTSGRPAAASASIAQPPAVTKLRLL